MEKKSRREVMPFPIFTKIIINHFFSQHKSLSKLKHQHYHIIKDDGIVSRLKFVRFGKKTVVDSQETVDISKESEPKPAKKKVGSRRTKSVVIQDTPSVPKPKLADLKLKLKGIQTSTLDKQLTADTMQAIKNSKENLRGQSNIRGSSEGTGIMSRVPDESTVVFSSSHERTGVKLGVPVGDLIRKWERCPGAQLDLSTFPRFILTCKDMRVSDGCPSIEERTDLFLEAQDHVKKMALMDQLMNRHGNHNSRGTDDEQSKNPFREYYDASSDEQDTLSPEGFIDWLVVVEEVFEFKEVPENKRVLLIATKLRGRASAWWQQLKLTRERVGKPRITSWQKMKKCMRANFIPYNYQWQMYQRL
ncbi:reverse transcriptase domain-containing protein [Tanacetum coccineum]